MKVQKASEDCRQSFVLWPNGSFGHSALFVGGKHIHLRHSPLSFRLRAAAAIVNETQCASLSPFVGD